MGGGGRRNGLIELVTEKEARGKPSTAVSSCEDRVLDGPASGEKGPKGGPYKYCNPRT